MLIHAFTIAQSLLYCFENVAMFFCLSTEDLFEANVLCLTLGLVKVLTINDQVLGKVIACEKHIYCPLDVTIQKCSRSASK